jgi:hypothetical protein
MQRDATKIDEAEFWRRVVREGLPRFRWLRRSIDVVTLDLRFGTWAEWLRLKERLHPGDKIWPFEFHVRSYLGMRRGFVALRRGELVGGVVTEVS